MSAVAAIGLAALSIGPAAVCDVVARRHGLSGPWVLIGLLLGPVAFPVLVFGVMRRAAR